MYHVCCYIATLINKMTSGNESYLTIATVKDAEKEALENIVGKGENAGYQHFLLFH